MFELASRLVGVYKVNHMTKSVTIENRDYIVRPHHQQQQQQQQRNANNTLSMSQMQGGYRDQTTMNLGGGGFRTSQLGRSVNSNA